MTHPDARDAEAPEPLDLLGPTYREAPMLPEGGEPPPLWLWVSIVGALLVGVYYLGAHVGDFSAAPVVHAAGPAPAPAEAAPPDGAALYASRCAACHQADGAGVPGSFPPLAGASWVTGDKGVLVRILLHGMNGPVEVAGQTYDGNMPGWAALSDAEIAAVTTHERSSWGNAAEPVTAEEVAAIRALTVGRDRPWAADELSDPANQGVPEPEVSPETDPDADA